MRHTVLKFNTAILSSAAVERLFSIKVKGKGQVLI